MASRPFQEGFWGGLGSSRGHLGGVLGRSWGLLGPYLGGLGVHFGSFGVAGAVVLGLDSLNRFYASIEPCDSTMRFVDARFGMRFVDSIYQFDLLMRFADSIRALNNR